MPKHLRGGAISGIVPGAGAAEYGDGVNVWHGHHVDAEGRFCHRFRVRAGNFAVTWASDS
jgi:hypothetical protein